MVSVNTCAFGLLVAFILLHQSQSSSYCRPFNKTSGLAEICGYTATAKFSYQSHYQAAIKSLKNVVRLLSSCSEYTKVIACSVYAPRCEPFIDGPFLPCRRVCNEFNSKCRDKIERYGMEWIIGMCQLLPEKDDPYTKAGYLGRCFEPPGFKTSVTKNIPVKCVPLIVPICQNIGYTHTLLPESRQKAYSKWACDKLGSAIDRQECSLPRKQFFCMENFPPCVGNSIGFYCRSKCQEFFKMNCTLPIRYKSDICMEFPDGEDKNNVCLQKHWPRADNWPHVRNTRISSAPPIVTTAPAKAKESTGTSTTPRNSTVAPTSLPVNSNPNGVAAALQSKASTANVATVVGITLACVVVILLAALIGFKVYRNKKRESSFPYDKQILYNEDVIKVPT